MILLFSSGGEEIYKQFVLRVLCYPTEHILSDVPYSLDRVASPFDQSPADLVKEQKAVIVLVDYVITGNDGGSLEPVFLPLRMATIIRASRFAGKLLLDVRLGSYPYYDEEIRRGYHGNSYDLGARLWSRVIRETPLSPRPKPSSSDKPIKPDDRSSWVSSGKFVLKIADEGLDFQVHDSRGEETIRAECDDWKSVIDMVTQRGQFEDKLFYQIWGLRKPEVDLVRKHFWSDLFYGVGVGVRLKKSIDEDGVRLLTLGDRSVYELSAGDSAELVLHFYQGKKRLAQDKKTLEIITDDSYLTTLGMLAIDVYPQQTSGKIEQLRLIAKKQLSQEFTRVTIHETNVQTPTLAGSELYIRLQPRRGYIGAILIAFFLGTLLNSLPEHFRWIWVWKVLGGGLMAGAFWLAFSKFPSK
jgi:hypothetical protein